ncbi:hypothetical protein CARN8_5690004 [mine drainage metagenome]|uniref:Uncharacterized protein n=1 Tax=mine drainage metagenome TaxID=410659 RepID=A0A3P3ZQV9_9ZZZZ
MGSTRPDKRAATVRLVVKPLFELPGRDLEGDESYRMFDMESFPKTISCEWCPMILQHFDTGL